MERKQASDFDPEVLRLYDDYAHGRLDRREYMRRLGAFALGGLRALGEDGTDTHQSPHEASK